KHDSPPPARVMLADRCHHLQPPHLPSSGKTECPRQPTRGTARSPEIRGHNRSSIQPFPDRSSGKREKSCLVVECRTPTTSDRLCGSDLFLCRLAPAE